MKNLFKTATVLVVITSATIAAKAQTTSTSASKEPNGIIFSVGVDGGLTTGTFKDSHKAMVGGSLEADFPVADQFYITANTGYNQFFGRDNVFGTGIKAPDINIIPVKLGLKYFPISVLYLQAEAGVAFLTNKSTLGFERTGTFIFSPQVGTQIPLGGKSFLDAGVRYEGCTNFTKDQESSRGHFFALRVAYAFCRK
jgi:phosphate-selective porin